MNDEKSEVKDNFKEWEFIIEEKERLTMIEDELNERVGQMDLQEKHLTIALQTLELYEKNTKNWNKHHNRMANALERIADKL